MKSGRDRPRPEILKTQKFTGKERDAESGLDYFGARYFSGAQGRFVSPDWSAKPQPVPYANLRDPQTLNLYAYVRNNPLQNHDPDGHLCVFGFIGSCSTPSVTSSISFPAYDPPITSQYFPAVVQGVQQSAPVVNAAFVATAAVPAAAFGVAALAGLSTTTLVAGGTAVAGAAESPQGQQAIDSISAAANPTSVFWSGPGAQAATETWASANNGLTLGMTQLGQEAENGSMTWEQASEQFAQQASGTAQVLSNNPLTPFVNPQTGQVNIWYGIELPTLANNPNVTNMVFNPVPSPQP